MWKSIVSKAGVESRDSAAVLGLAVVPYPAHAAPASGSDTVQASTCAAQHDEEWPTLDKAGGLRNWSRSFAGP